MNYSSSLKINPIANPEHKKKTLTLSTYQLEELSVILFFGQSFVRWILEYITPTYAGYISILLPFGALCLLFLLRRGRMRIIDFPILFIGICAFFLITYLIHPDYSFWYKRSYYGIWDYVLRPDNGIYAYLFLRVIDDPKRILKSLRISAFLIYIYSAYIFYQATVTGYWLTTWAGELRKLSYSLEFGYDLLPSFLVFFYLALKNKKAVDWLMTIAGLIMILGAGSRGPVLDIMIFVVLYFFTEVSKSRKKTVICSGVAIGGVAAYFLYKPILKLLSRIMNLMGLSSRFIQLFLEGQIADDNGRIHIWQKALEMIRENPFGYGAMGSRHQIYYIIQVGHPHNVVLEILIDFGVFIGGALLIWGAVTLIKTLRSSIRDEWKGLVLIYIGVSSQLLLSGTYWHRTGIWALLALGMSIHLANRKERSENG